MNEKSDGGPAFPVPVEISNGMSLRDWFAGMALHGLLSSKRTFSVENPARSMSVEEDWAKIAFVFADAMLKVKPQ